MWKIKASQVGEILDAYNLGVDRNVFIGERAYFHFFTRPGGERCVTFHSNAFNFMINGYTLYPKLHAKNKKLVIKCVRKGIRESLIIFIGDVDEDDRWIGKASKKDKR